MKNRLTRSLFAALAATALTLTACAPTDSPDPANSGDGSADWADQGDIAALVEAAKKEGTVVWYTDQPPATDEAAAQAFKQEFGINVEYVALNSVPIQQRYASEADAGAFAADVVTLGNSDQFLSDAIDKGWGMKITDAELPVLELGTFPEEFMQGDNTATVGVSPFLILYNKANVAEGDLPESLSDLTDPRFKDKILLADPSASDALTAFYIVLQEELGDEWFEGVMKNNPKFYPAVSAAGQAMVAGEGDFVTPALRAVGAALQDSGAPVDAVIPPVTTGPKFNLMLTATENSPNPNAAKLFANWLLSESGSIAAQGGVGLSPYQSDELPSGFVEMPEATPEKKAQVLSLLGLD